MMRAAEQRVVLYALLIGICAARPAAAQDAGAFESRTPAVPSGVEAAPPIKALPDRVEEAVGTWDLSLQGANRRCTLTLSIESGRNGRALRFPAGCRRALPILGKVAGWFFLGSEIRLVDDNVRPVLAFAASADRGSLFGRAEGGEIYNLVPLQTMGMLPAAPTPAAPERAGTDPAAIPDVAGARGIPGAEPVLPADALLPPIVRPGTEAEPSPGIYALDRFGEKDVCRIELTPQRTGRRPGEAQAEARLLPGCRDNGVTVFDPVAWRFANGHMTLRARKGHAINLVATREGAWRRDPDTGVTFVLRRVE